MQHHISAEKKITTATETEIDREKKRMSENK